MAERIVTPEYLIPIKRRWKKITDKELREWERSDPAKYDKYDRYISSFQRNPLAFTMPHGNARKDVQGNDGRACLNDYEHDLIVVTAPNQTGKSYLGAIYTALRILPWSKDWLCVDKHGIKPKPFTGPKIAIIASYSWDNVNTVWETYQKILPREELGQYAPNYGEFEEEEGKARNLTFGDGKPKQIQLKCGSKLVFLCYTQSLTHWEGRQCDIAHLDEQCPEDKFDALTARQLTRGSYTPIIMTLTGHVVDGRPDTGAGGWIKTQLVDGRATKGRKYINYKIRMPDVPNAIISKEAKRQSYEQWVLEPQRTNNDKKRREGEARYFGGWEVGGGLVISEWNPDYHLIEPFDFKKYDPTFYRMIDHGQDPCVALIIIKLPWGDSVVIKEYYEYGKTISQNAQAIVEWSGNECMLDDEFGTAERPVKQELMSGVEFYASEMDCRSFNTKSVESRKLIGSIYNDSGLSCSPADPALHLIDPLKEQFALNVGGTHINKRLGREWSDDLAKFGAPNIYIFNTCVNLRAEIESYTFNPKTGKPIDKNDHAISCAKFYACRERRYMGDYGITSVEEPRKKKVSSYTGY